MAESNDMLFFLLELIQIFDSDQTDQFLPIRQVVFSQMRE